MPKFNVTISGTNIVTVEIDANDEREACDIANKMMDDDEINFSSDNAEYKIDSVEEIGQRARDSFKRIQEEKNKTNI